MIKIRAVKFLFSLFYMFYKQRAIYVHPGCQVLLVISSFHMLWPSLSSTPLVPRSPSRSPPSPWSCPLPGFRLMTSDSPLRGASCLQSAVRLLVIIFQSVTLVSALWRCEEERGRRPWLAGWLKPSGCDARRWASGVAAAMEQAVTALCLPSFNSRVSVLKRHRVL